MSISIDSERVVVAARAIDDDDVAKAKAEDVQMTAEIAARIRRALELRGLGYNELDRSSGLGVGYTSRMLSLKKKRPGTRTLQAVAGALRVDYRWLVTGQGEMSSDVSTARIRTATAGAAITASEINPDLAATVQLYRRRRKWSAAAIFVADQVGQNRAVAPEEWPSILDEAEQGIVSLAATLTRTS